MFLTLMEKVFTSSTSTSTNINNSTLLDHGQHHSSTRATMMTISITIYNAKQNQYPSSKMEWDEYQGIIITGSLSAAYDGGKYPWIARLMDEIQMNIHSVQRKTLGVCFGHQIYAHSFSKNKRNITSSLEKEMKEDVGMESYHENSLVDVKCIGNCGDSGDYGLAVKCPKGMQVGIRTFDSLPLFPSTCDYNKDNNTSSQSKIQMLYTHGDMVQSIPTCALSLGGNPGVVPIQSCAYFASREEKDAYVTFLNNSQNHGFVQSSSFQSPRKPYAITFQGHPEYASKDVGLKTYLKILDFLEEKMQIKKEEQEIGIANPISNHGKDEDEIKLSSAALDSARNEAKHSFEDIERNCGALMRDVMITLDWM